MTDKELLELAAKAAGIELLKHGMSGGIITKRGMWNPLTDDGDALRLAVLLKMLNDLQGIIEMYVSEHEFAEDPYAATRRAIVRAAAEIGEQHGKD